MAKTGIYFYPSSIKKCYSQIEKIPSRYEKKIEELLKRLGELGQNTAWNKYHETQLNPSPEDRHTIQVSYSLIDTNTIEIRANGKGVCFLEFGAGVATDESHPFADKVPFKVVTGSWSQEHAQQFSKNGYWYFGGVKYTQTKKRAGMYEAYKQITEQVYKIAKEVLG